MANCLDRIINALMIRLSRIFSIDLSVKNNKRMTKCKRRHWLLSRDLDNTQYLILDTWLLNRDTYTCRHFINWCLSWPIENLFPEHVFQWHIHMLCDVPPKLSIQIDDAESLYSTKKKKKKKQVIHEYMSIKNIHKFKRQKLFQIDVDK